MFIWDLRGAFGWRMSLTFHAIVLFSGFGLYLLESLALELLVCVSMLVAHVCLVRYIRAHRHKLEFSKPTQEAAIFPATKEQRRIILIIHALFFSLPFPLMLVNFVIDRQFPDGLLLGMMLIYYVGSLGFVGLINLYLHSNKGNEA